MLKHAVTHRSNSSLSHSSGSSSLSSSLYFQERRSGSLSTKSPIRKSESVNCSPFSSRSDHRNVKVMSPKLNGSRSFAELVNLLDAHPTMDFEIDSTSEASFCSLDSPMIQYKPKSHSWNESVLRDLQSSTLPKHIFQDNKSMMKESESFSSLISSVSCSSLGSIESGLQHNTPPTETIPVKVYLRRLRPDMEYKTMPLSSATTCRQLIISLLNKFRLRHRDPNLFFVMMEVSVRSALENAPIKRLLVLDDNARPAELQQCRPKGEARFSIGVRRGGLVRVHDSILMPGSQYKSLMISYSTTSEQLVQLLLKCYNNTENHLNFALHEICKNPYSDRQLCPEECPLILQADWPKLDRSNRAFVLRRNLDYSFNLKARLKWRKCPEKSNCSERESKDKSENYANISHPYVTDIRGSSFSSTGSVSSNCSSSSESSLDSGYLGSPLSSFRFNSPTIIMSRVSKISGTNIASQSSKEESEKCSKNKSIPSSIISNNASKNNCSQPQVISKETSSTSIQPSLSISNNNCSFIKLEPLPVSMKLNSNKLEVQSSINNLTKISHTNSKSENITDGKVTSRTPLTASKIHSQRLTNANISVYDNDITLVTSTPFSSSSVSIISTEATPKISKPLQSIITPIKPINLKKLPTLLIANDNFSKPKIVGEIYKNPLLEIRSYLFSILSSENLPKYTNVPKTPPSSPTAYRRLFISSPTTKTFSSTEKKFFEALELIKSLGNS